MNLLAIETSTDACSAALLCGNEISTHFEYAPLQHSRLILQFVDHLLAEAGIPLSQCDAIAFGRGPGSFTGVRIAASIVQGLSFAHDLPVVPISTLHALADDLYRETGEQHILAVLDARMHEVYAAYYQAIDGTLQRQSPEMCVKAPLLIPPRPVAWVGVGNGVHLCQNLTKTYLEYHPHARAIAHLAKIDFNAGKTVAPEFALPTYLRDEVTT